MEGPTAAASVEPTGGRYRFLLIALLALFVAIPATGFGTVSNWLLTLAFLGVLLTGLLAVARDRRLRLPVLLLAVLTVVPFRDDPTGLLTQGPDLVFMGLVAAAIMRDVARRRRITLDAVYGASCVYLFLGLCWGKAYAILETAFPGSFGFGTQTTVAPFAAPAKNDLLMYLSFITLTTTGYGDVTPLSPPARVLAVLEAIIGQLFMAITIARLVGLYTAAANATEADPG